MPWTCQVLRPNVIFQHKQKKIHYSLNPLSPSFVAMSFRSTVLTFAAGGPLFKCCTNWFSALCSP